MDFGYRCGKVIENKMFIRYLVVILFLLIYGNSNGSQEDSVFEVCFVVTEKAYIYEEPKSKAKIVDSAEVGDYFWVSGKTANEKNWYKIDFSSGKFGWVNGEDVLTKRPLQIYSREDSVIFRELPSLNSKIVYIDKKRERFRILGKLEIQEDHIPVEWYKTADRHNKTGYLLVKEVSNPFLEQLVLIGEALMGRIGSMDLPLSVNLRLAKKVFLKIYEKENEFFLHYYEGGVICDSKPYALKMLSLIDVKENSYEQAIEKLFRIVQEYPDKNLGIGKADGVAYLEIAETYLQKGDLHQAISTYYEIITQYPEVEISGFEWNSTLDLEAIRKLIKIYWQVVADEKLKGDYSLQDGILLEFQQTLSKIIVHSPNEVVKALAILEQAKIEKEKGNLNGVISRYKQAVENYPKAKFQFYTDIHHYACEALDYVTSTYIEETNKFYEAKSFLEKVIEENQDTILVAYTKLCYAKLLDYGMGKVSEVIERSNQIPDFQIFSEKENYWVWNGRAKARAAELEVTFGKPPKGKIGIIKDKKAGVFSFCYHKDPPEFFLSQGDTVEVFYSKPDARGIPYFKIETQKGEVGWVNLNDFDMLKN